MKLRLILLVLSLLTFLATSIGGYLYYASLKASAYKEAERQSLSRVQLINKNLSLYLSENIKPVKTLAEFSTIQQVFIRNDPEIRKKANDLLDHFTITLNVDVCYLMDHKGTTIASSNRADPDSFVGLSFAFRPYFKDAIKGKPATYLALGTTSKRRGAYYSHPIYAGDSENPAGVVVIKASITQIEQGLGPLQDETILVTDPRSVIFISNRKDWRYRTLWKLSPEEISQIARTRQFGTGPWSWAGIELISKGYAVDSSGEEYLLHQVELDNFPGWRVIHLRKRETISKIVSEPLLKTTGPIVLTLCILVGTAVFFLYRKASTEILQRRAAESALRKSEERYRSLYHHTPAMLHSIDKNGYLVSVSDYWADALGYTREEAVGRKLTDFLTRESSNYAEYTVFPQFFRDGYCKDVAYQFVKKDGGRIDVLLSAIADRDSLGNVIRSLAVSIDVTERKRAEEALQRAKEELSRHTRDLERQVRKRTREITSILEYTPAVVYIKDARGQYLLVNSRFEELFNISAERVRGKTDHEILPKKVAEQFQRHDQKALGENHSYQVTEHIPQADGLRTYLSIKFPIYDEAGSISGVCGIATDITAVKKAQDQLRRLSGGIMANQEKERSAIARELHDELGQVLTALRMDAVWILEHLKASDPKAADRALTMCRLIDKTIKEVRNMAIRLRPGVLDDLGLVDALEWYTSDFERRAGITCIFEHRKIPNLMDSVATAAYRIAQEALTNVARHAHANRVIVSLDAREGVLTLAVADNGKGFDTEKLSESEGLGVAGMRERASLVGGTLGVNSGRNKGTRILLMVPLTKPV